jgi:hypothetical protein
MGNHPDWTDFLQSDDWAPDEEAAKILESSTKDDIPTETYKMAGAQRRVPSKHVISLDEFDDIKNIVATSRAHSSL